MNTTLTDGSPVTLDHKEIDPETGMQKGYIVLSEEEQAKGYVRPVRDSYIHTACGIITMLGYTIAETFACDPTFYTGTFCTGCKDHFPLSEFNWLDDNSIVGS